MLESKARYDEREILLQLLADEQAKLAKTIGMLAPPHVAIAHPSRLAKAK